MVELVVSGDDWVVVVARLLVSGDDWVVVVVRLLVSGDDWVAVVVRLVISGDDWVVVIVRLVVMSSPCAPSFTSSSVCSVSPSFSRCGSGNVVVVVSSPAPSARWRLCLSYINLQ